MNGNECISTKGNVTALCSTLPVGRFELNEPRSAYALRRRVAYIRGQPSHVVGEGDRVRIAFGVFFSTGVPSRSVEVSEYCVSAGVRRPPSVHGFLSPFCGGTFLEVLLSYYIGFTFRYATSTIDCSDVPRGSSKCPAESSYNPPIPRAKHSLSLNRYLCLVC